MRSAGASALNALGVTTSASSASFWYDLPCTAYFHDVMPAKKSPALGSELIADPRRACPAVAPLTWLC
jgi:hypothetical protein